MLSERIASLYAYGTYHTRMVIPYAYGIQNCTIRVRYIPYAYGMFFFFFFFIYCAKSFFFGTYHMVHTIRVWYVPYAYGIKYAYGTEQQHSRLQYVSITHAHTHTWLPSHYYTKNTASTYATFTIASLDNYII